MRPRQIRIMIFVGLLTLLGTCHSQVQDLKEPKTDDIPKLDYAAANRVVEKAIRTGDPLPLRAALKHNSLPIRIRAVSGLVKVGDKASVPYLIAALRDNRVIRIGGSEDQELQKELNFTIVQAIQVFSGLDFHVKDKDSPMNVDNIIETTEAWWKTHGAHKK